MDNDLNLLIDSYKKIKKDIQLRIIDFKNVWKYGNDDDIFSELAFCLFTPQSKAKNCWYTVNLLKKNNLLYEGKAEDISKLMNLVRFKNNKAKYLVSSRNFFFQNKKLNIKKKISEIIKNRKDRDWIVKNIKGLGLKESAHFLRNIGANLNYAILDRHILKNLKRYGVIDEIPNTISLKKYLKIEKKMIAFSEKINIPISHLDLLFWYKEVGEIFK